MADLVSPLRTTCSVVAIPHWCAASSLSPGGNCFGTVVSVLQGTDKSGGFHDPGELCMWEHAQLSRIMTDATMVV
jgi:hypothetical protein